MFKNKKMCFFLAVMSLMLSLFMIQETYAKYLTTAEGVTSTNIARWKLNINNQDITSNQSITNVLTPNFIKSEHVKDGVIAPKSEGFFDIIIDSSNVDVSFNYSITTSVNENSSVTDLKVTGYSINGSNIVSIETGQLENISNNILYNSGVTTSTIRIYFTWDDDNGTMDNAADTMATLNNGTANLTVNLNFKQIV